MTAQAKSNNTANPRKRRRSLPILIVLLCLLSLVLLKTCQDPKSGPPNISHVQFVMAKQTAWLGQHPLLLKVSQINFAGVPGELITSTCWHLMKTISRHRRPQIRTHHFVSESVSFPLSKTRS